MPQPVPWVRATTPSMWEKSASAAGFVWREKCAAMARATVAEQLTLLRMPM